MLSPLTTVPVKLLVEQSRRRARLTVPLRLAALQQRVRSSFPELAGHALSIQYVDDEGDNIVVTTDDELEEAQRVYEALGRVLSFVVFAEHSESDDNEDNRGAVFGLHPGPFVKVDRIAACKTSRMYLAGFVCDVKGPGCCQAADQNAQWWHNAASQYDVCTVCYANNCTKDIVGVAKTTKEVAKTTKENMHGRRHWGRHRGKGPCGVKGRYEDRRAFMCHKIAHKMGLTGSDMPSPWSNLLFRRMVQATDGCVPHFHFGITCDGSGQHPLVGTRYHKVGEDYDLNETEFAKLSPSEQQAYEAIAYPGAVPVPVDGAAPTSSAIAAELSPTEKKASLECTFVQDLTIPDNTTVEAGKQLDKRWLVKTGAAGWPAGCTLTHISGDSMGADTPISLSKQPPGTLVELSVVFTAPATTTGKPVVSKWRVAGPDGQAFGDFVWATVQVIDTEKQEPPSLSPDAADVAEAEVDMKGPVLSCTPRLTVRSSNASAKSNSQAHAASPALHQLVAMGFRSARARAALDLAAGDLTKAVATLLQ